MDKPLHAPAGDTARIAPEVAQQAVHWWMQLRGASPSTRQQAAWQRWLAQSPEHAAAWQRIESMGQQMAGISLPLARAALAGPDTMRRRRTMQLLTGLVVTGAGVTALVRSQAWSVWSADEVAAVGEQRRLALPDGGHLVVNTGGAVNIRYGADRRVVQLVQGEILVQTAPDAAHRTFSVQTAMGEVRALGTRFTVRQQEGRVHVGVLQGAVELRPVQAPGAVQLLQKGEQGALSGTRAEVTGPVDEGTGAWADGMLVVSRMRLDAFLAELGRYRRGRIGCEAAIAHLPVSGAYPLADTDRILAALTSSLPVQVHFFSRYWVMVRPSLAAAPGA